MKQGKKKGKGRDLTSFRKTLAVLQSQVDELDRIKGDYHGEVGSLFFSLSFVVCLESRCLTANVFFFELRAC